MRVNGVDVREPGARAALELDRARPPVGVPVQRHGREQPAGSETPEATDAELWRALELAQAHDFVAAMPGQLDAAIDQGGTNVSGGQRQRLSIARALVRRPRLYLFDDCFSALDAATDARLRAAIKAETRDAAVVIVAQRVSTIMHADLIVVLEDGDVAGVGTHAELIAGCEPYREIVAVPAGRGGGSGMMGGPARAGMAMGGRPPRRSGARTSARRCAGCSTACGPSARSSSLALALGVTSVAFVVTGPKILGDATNILFDGIVGKQLPGRAHEAAGGGAAARPRPRPARGHGLRDERHARARASTSTQFGRVLGLAALVYLLAAVFSFGQGFILAGVTQRTMFRLRRDVEEKLARLPLRYFDSHPHGDILSRVTNDIDNLSTTLQQGLSQLLTSVLTVVGVLAMMFWISPLLAAISMITIPLAILITFLIARRSQVQFAAQWQRTGTLNGLVEETHTGHTLVQVYGRRGATVDEFDRQNREPVRGELPGAVPLRADPAGDAVRRQRQLRRDRRPRRLPGRLRGAVARRRAGVHPVLAPVHDAAHPDRQPDEPAAVRPRLRRARLRVPRRGGGSTRPRPGRSPAGRARRAT